MSATPATAGELLRVVAQMAEQAAAEADRARPEEAIGLLVRAGQMVNSAARLLGYLPLPARRGR